MSKSRYPRSFAHPRYWPTWLGIGAMYVAAWLPWRLKMRIGKGLGLLAWRFAKRRRHIYRPHNNPLFERFMTRARGRNFGTAIDRSDLRGVVRQLKAGRMVWYSPDQDFGRDVSVFAPLFGQQAATIRLMAKLARMTGASVVPMMFHRNPDNATYTIESLPALEGFPSNDEVADATKVNQFIEQAIRKHPEQYLWLHRRFKTRPEGEPSVY